MIEQLYRCKYILIHEKNHCNVRVSYNYFLSGCKYFWGVIMNKRHEYYQVYNLRIYIETDDFGS